jgi:hypothetical protein
VLVKHEMLTEVHVNNHVKRPLLLFDKIISRKFSKTPKFHNSVKICSTILAIFRVNTEKDGANYHKRCAGTKTRLKSLF